MKCIEMDETDRPYEDGEQPRPRTLEDDLYLLKMVKENGWELKEGSYLADLERRIQNIEPSKAKLVEHELIEADEEDAYDLKVYEEAMEEYQKNPVTYPFEEFMKELGLED